MLVLAYWDSLITDGWPTWMHFWEGLFLCKGHVQIVYGNWKQTLDLIINERFSSILVKDNIQWEIFNNIGQGKSKWRLFVEPWFLQINHLSKDIESLS